MTDFEYGPVEVYLIGFAGERPGPEVVAAVVDLVRGDAVALLDLVFVSKSLQGDVTVVEADEVADGYGLAGLDPAEPGLAGQEDIDELAEAIEPGTSAVTLVVEHLWARAFAEALYRADGQVLRTERIPAPVVNRLVAAAVAD
jgi:uncharacterized membrane protein